MRELSELSELSDAERRLWEAYPAGAVVDLRAGHDHGAGSATEKDPDKTVRAELIARLLLGARTPEAGRNPGVRLVGARISGTLDLSSVQVDTPLLIQHSVFDSTPILTDAAMRSVDLTGCALPGLDGRGLRTDRALIIDSCRVEGGIVLRDARIGGSLYLADSWIYDPGGRAVDADHLVVEGRVDARQLVAEGAIRVHNGQVAGEIILYGASLTNPAGYALSLGGLKLGGGMFCTQGFTARGESRLIGVQLANLTLRNATLINPGGVTLDLEQAVIRRIDAGEGFRSTGAIRLVGTQVSGRVDLTDARVDGSGGGTAIDAESLGVGEALLLNGIHAAGEVDVRMARVSGRIDLTGARLENPDGIALVASRTDVGADVLADNAFVQGEFRITGGRVGNRLSFDGARLINPEGTAFDAQTLQAASLYLLPREPPKGLVTLRHARISVIRDERRTWPEELRLDGLVYEVLEPRLRARERLRWIARDVDGYQPQPYEQLAGAYTRIGQHLDSRRVLYAKERRHRRTQTVLGRI
ncbi:MAG: hypothetical protein GEV03_12100 [Streptosporangiales bacterium]|nr:hypothetical protein [Streptosporangiales bacterium]